MKTKTNEGIEPHKLEPNGYSMKWGWHDDEGGSGYPPDEVKS